MLPFIVPGTCVPLALYCTWYVRTSFVNHTKLKTLILITGSRVVNSRPTYMPASSKRVHCCIHVSRDFFFFGGWDLAFYCTCVPRVCRMIPCPIQLVRTWYRTVSSGDNNFVLTNLRSNQHRFFWWDVYKKMQHHQQACTLLYACLLYTSPSPRD